MKAGRALSWVMPWVLAGTALAQEAPLARPSPAAPATPAADPAEESLRRAEAGFAAAFAARDPEKFASFLDESAVFMGTSRRLRGRAEVAEAWKRMMMEGATPPFSWRPERVLVNGDLGLSSGPVYDRSGKWTGAFTSVWRRQADGSWKIVLDMAAPCTAPAGLQPAAE